MSMSALIEKFRTVALDRLNVMRAHLTSLGERPDDLVARQSVLREAHTLKGEARMLGFVDVNLVAHLTEHLLLDADARGFQADDDHAALIRTGLDIMQAMLTKTPGNFGSPVDLTGFVERVYRGGHGPSAQASLPPTTTPTPPAPTTPAAQLRIAPPTSMRVELSHLETLGESSSELVLLTRRLDYQLNEFRRVNREFSELTRDTARNLPKSQQARFRQSHHQFEVLGAQMREELQQATLRAAQVDEEARRLRHVPIAEVLSHYPRAVGEIAQSLGKRVRFDHAYGDVQIDRMILSGLSDPLLHLIRNAIDHGIELPEDRLAAGKPPEGLVRIEAEHAGDAVRVTLRDDGRGIDPQTVKHRAVSRGFITEDEASSMGDADALALLFRHGFSTRETVTDLSGRGVGLDIVRRELAQLGGSVDIESQPGQGTAFHMVLPVSSAVSRVLLLKVSGQRFALPANRVENVVVEDASALQTTSRGLHLEVDGEDVPVLDFSTVLGLSPRPIRDGKLTLLVLQRGKRRIAAWVDEVIGVREAISRPLGELLAGVQTCRGVAITDSGVVAPILNLDVALERVRAPRRTELRTTAMVEAPVAIKTVLVVEDSEITRTLVSGILRGLGHRVIEAEDGSQAVKRLADHRIDLVLSDVQMPGMSGLDLLEHIRNTPKTRALPVIMLTTLAADRDREQALLLGADAYLTKLNFQEKDLIRIVQRYLGV